MVFLHLIIGKIPHMELESSNEHIRSTVNFLNCTYIGYYKARLKFKMELKKMAEVLNFHTKFLVNQYRCF